MSAPERYMKALRRVYNNGNMSKIQRSNFVKNWNNGKFSEEQMKELRPLAKMVNAGKGWDYQAERDYIALHEERVANGEAKSLRKGLLRSRSQGDWSRGFTIREILGWAKPTESPNMPKWMSWAERNKK